MYLPYISETKRINRRFPKLIHNARLTSAYCRYLVYLAVAAICTYLSRRMLWFAYATGVLLGILYVVSLVYPQTIYLVWLVLLLIFAVGISACVLNYRRLPRP